MEEKRQLLLGCGIWMNANLYEGARRLLLGGSLLIGGMGYAAFEHPWLSLHMQPAVCSCWRCGGVDFSYFGMEKCWHS